jgi:serine kinase of HPr protein (carbohydrate metabolism regulator)
LGDAPDKRATVTVHATAIAVDGRAALLFGASGSGKSDLALRCLIPVARLGGSVVTPELVADDQVEISLDGEHLVCRPPPTIAGRIEVRGLGIVDVPHVQLARVALAVVLDGPPAVRMPEPAARQILGIDIPEIRLSPFEASAPMKLLVALHQAR